MSMIRFIATSHLIIGMCVALFVFELLIDKSNENKLYTGSILLASVCCTGILVFGHAKAKNWARIFSIVLVLMFLGLFTAIIVGLVVSWGFDYELFMQQISVLGISVILILFFTQPSIANLYKNVNNT